MFTKAAFLLYVVCFAQTYRCVSGAPGASPGVHGSIGECLNITPSHLQIAKFAIRELGSEYTLRKLLGVRTQVVAGVNYYLELHVSKTTAGKHYCEHCDAKVMEDLEGQHTLDHQHTVCKEVCCH